LDLVVQYAAQDDALFQKLSQLHKRNLTLANIGYHGELGLVHMPRDQQRSLAMNLVTHSLILV